MTASDLFALPGDPVGVDRWLIAGELIERWNGNGFHTPAHAAGVAAVSSLISHWYREAKPPGIRAFGYGCPYRLTREPDTVVSYDVSVWRRTSGHADIVDASFIDIVDASFIEGAPLLAVEVMELDEDEDLLSRLVEVSLRGGVKSVWVVNPFEPLVVQHRSGMKPTYHNGGMEIIEHPNLPGFRCPVAEIFE
jgi:Uma2 family endonuclease